MNVLEAIQKAEEFSTEVVEETPVEKVEEEKVVDPEKVETPEVAEETEVVKNEEVADTPEPAPTEVVEKTEPTVNKVKVDYLKFLEENDSVISAYKTEKSLDYSKMEPDKVLAKSLKVKYPNLSDEDINEELKDRYGIGVDTEDLDAEELIAHKAKQRKLKIDASEAVSALEAYRDSLTLPEFELEIPVETKEETIDIDKVYEERAKEQLDSDLAWRKDVWTPEVTKAVNSLDKISQKIDLGGDLGEVEFEIDLDEADKKSMSEYLAGWTYHPSDSAYLKDGEAPDLVAFAKDRGLNAISSKVLAAVGMAAVNKYKETHVKKEMINFNDTPSTKQIPKYEEGAAEGLAAMLRK